MILGSALEVGGAEFLEQYADALLSFDGKAVEEALDSLYRLGTNLPGRDADKDDWFSWFESSFALLYQRGAIIPVRPFSTSGQSQLDELISTYRFSQ